jgi:poly [ADP-ribose] polymerase
MAAKVKAWTNGDVGEPSFPQDFEVVKKAVLQVTDIQTNRNKYYAIELHATDGGGSTRYRVFTHYGRTDDLEANPDAGQKECRYFDVQWEAEACYDSIYRQKTSTSKGYKEVALASSKIGSQRARGSGVGDIDVRTLERMAKSQVATADGAGDATPAPVPGASKLHAGVQGLVRYIYDEAKGALTSTVAAKITAHGIETPLGILTLGQIEKGEAILAELYDRFQDKNAQQGNGGGPTSLLPKKFPGKTALRLDEEMTRLSGEFYTAIPHRIGRTRAAVAGAVINTLEAFEQKQQTLQLMKDMLQVNGEAGSVLFDARIDQEYDALRCRVEWLEPQCSEYKEMADHVLNSQIKTRNIKVTSLYRVRREGEWDSFTEHIGNHRLMFHGSRIQNWVGILSRGILLPKIVVSMGVRRTDPGWLGHGIYFGDAACTSLFYTTPGRKKTRLMAIARVALGKMKDYTQITYGLTAPPPGYNSCRGVRAKAFRPSQFADDEYVVYDVRQQRLEYLVEFVA